MSTTKVSNKNYNHALTLGNDLIYLEKYEKAIKCYDEIIKINPNCSEAYYNKGIALYNLNRKDEVLKCYDKIIEINPNYSDAY